MCASQISVQMLMIQQTAFEGSASSRVDSKSAFDQTSDWAATPHRMFAVHLNVGATLNNLAAPYAQLGRSEDKASIRARLAQNSLHNWTKIGSQFTN